MSSDFLGGHCCAQMKAVPGEDRLALEKEWYWPNGSEIVVNMWGYVASQIPVTFLYLFPPDLCRSLTSSYRQSDFVRSKVIQVKIRSQSQTCRMWPGANLVELVDSGTVANPIQFANEWTRYANLTFKWMERDALGDSDIRISFDRDGYWSALGTNCRNISQDQPTMNYGGMTDNTSDLEFSTAVCHEFGHALGFIHEQASPIANIQWNKPVVYEYYQRVYGWSQASVDFNLFLTANQEDVINSRYDRTSIM
tara:strand:- start:1364 stop:2119 length:756 start_codon:yes stop_codon:yes gene_type:complete